MSPLHTPLLGTLPRIQQTYIHEFIVQYHNVSSANITTCKVYRYGPRYELYIYEPELHFFEGELMGEQELPQPRLFE